MSTLVSRKTLGFGLAKDLLCLFSSLHLQSGQKIIEGQSLAFHGNVYFLGYGIAELFRWRQDEHLVDLHQVH